MSKVILVVIDGLAYEVAQQCMGYLQGLQHAKQITGYKMQCELPAVSRPLYECILTGTRPIDSGILNNDGASLSQQLSIFSLARAAKLTTAAAAYHWVSELYNRSPYEPVRDRFTQDPSLPIQYGFFYSQDHYPDCHLLQDGEILRTRFNPDFLLIHPMNTDHAGHQFGLDSAQYRNSARRFDLLLANYLPLWLTLGYQVLITSDHGMNKDGSHSGILAEERDIPLLVAGHSFSHNADARPQQIELCGTIASLLGLTHDKPMCQELLK